MNFGRPAKLVKVGLVLPAALAASLAIVSLHLCKICLKYFSPEKFEGPRCILNKVHRTSSRSWAWNKELTLKNTFIVTADPYIAWFQKEGETQCA